MTGKKSLLEAVERIDHGKINSIDSVVDYCEKYFSIKGAEEDMVRMIRDVAASKHQLRLLEKM